MTHVFSQHPATPAGPRLEALASFMRGITAQATMLSYIDVFEVLVIGCVVAAVLALFLKHVDPSKASAAA